jgi:tetratricopeptide (TPR) repeat protein
MTFDRLQTFSDPVLLWDDAARVAGGPPYRLGMERIYTNRGNGWAQMGALSRAIADYRLAVRINPQAPQPHYDLGGMYLAAGRNAAALHEYDQAVRLAPDVTMLYYFRGLAQARLQQPAAAVHDFSRVIAGRPRDAQAWLQRGIAEGELKQYPAALRDLDRASALDGGLKQVFWEKGRIYRAMQAPGLAAANFQRACIAGYQPACAVMRPAAGAGPAARR